MIEQKIIKFFGSEIIPRIPQKSFPQKSYFVEQKTKKIKKEKKIEEIEINGIVIYYGLPVVNKNQPNSLVKATYTNDLNIIKIHDGIRHMFGSKMGGIADLQSKILEHEIVLQGCLSKIDADKLLDQIKQLKAEINGLESGTLWKTYIDQALGILKEYAPLSSDEVRGIVKFMGNKSSVGQESKALIIKRQLIIEQYLSVAKKYIELNIARKVDIPIQCPGCGMVDEDTLLDEDAGIHTCECGFVRTNVIKTSTFKDSIRININSKSSYENRVTFEKGFDYYYGARVVSPPDLLFTMLDAYFTIKKFPIGSEIKSNPDKYPLLTNGKKMGTSIKMLNEALEATDNPAFYDRVNYIGHMYWGWVLPDLSYIKDRVMAKYDLSQVVYEQYKERNSSTNVNIRLYWHLRDEGIDCTLEDFKIPCSRSSLKYHHKILHIMALACGIKDTPII
jgi:hypothetical protein